MIGYKLCEKLVAKNLGQFEIIVFGEEIRPAYDRVHLSEFFSGKSANELTLAPTTWYADNLISLYLGDPVTRIDRDQKFVCTFHGLQQSYDYLVIATGSAAFVPPIPGVEKEGVFIYRTIEDLEMMQDYARKAKKGAVIGGGLAWAGSGKSNVRPWNNRYSGYRVCAKAHAAAN